FTPRCVCDGRKNIVSIHQLKLDTGFQEFDESPSLRDQKRPKVYNIKLTLVAEMNPEVLHCFIKGKASHDNTVLTATALNVSMQPSLSYPFNACSFFTDRETEDIGSGLELCKALQSVRPGIGKMPINVGTMYKKVWILFRCCICASG
ncbi:hypothetical protein K438DRAFT_1622097, partial [Mycena galopus ATCC 62051]